MQVTLFINRRSLKKRLSIDLKTFKLLESFSLEKILKVRDKTFYLEQAITTLEATSL